MRLCTKKNFIVAFAGFISFVGVLAHYLAGRWYPVTTLFNYGPDDVFISYRYAENLIAGHGLTWNIGERVEGYSDFLYVLIAAVGIYLKKSWVYEFCIAVNFFVFVVCGVLLLRRPAESDKADLKFFPFIFICTCPLIWLWIGSGFEPVLVAALVLGLALLSAKLKKTEGSPSKSFFVYVYLLSLLSILLRIDGFIVPGIFAFFLVLQRRWKAGLLLGAFVILVLGLCTAARLSYYGYPLPNTVYAKVSGSLSRRVGMGMRTLSEQTLSMILILCFCVSDFSWDVFCALRRRHLQSLSFMDIFTFFWICYFLCIGGDIYAERFLTPFLFLFPLQLVRRLVRFSSRIRLSILLLVITCNFLPLATDPRFVYVYPKHDPWRELGLFLKANFPGAVIAVDAAGKIPFFSELPTIDMLGLSDVHIAHTDPKGYLWIGHFKYDAPYVLEKHPRFIATWIHDDFNMLWGLEKSLYRAAGYHLRFLVNDETHEPPFIIDVGALSEEQQKEKIKAGYSYAVIERL